MRRLRKVPARNARRTSSLRPVVSAAQDGVADLGDVKEWVVEIFVPQFDPEELGKVTNPRIIASEWIRSSWWTQAYTFEEAMAIVRRRREEARLFDFRIRNVDTEEVLMGFLL